MQEAGVVTDSRAGDRKILGVSIRNLSCGRAIDMIDELIRGPGLTKIGFANAQTLNVACANPRFRSALEDFVVLNDGVGADIASRLKFGEPFTENLNGTDFVPAYLGGTRHTLKIYLVGTTEDVVARTARRLRLALPRHTIVGHRNGFFASPEDIEQTCRDIREAGADCVLVGMGNPLQELWIDEHAAKTGARLFFGVGALFDFEAGHVRRAPVWVRTLRCEWIFRLLQEPRRLAGRYMFGNVMFLARVLADVRG
jgi:alpha-1,3-mannosyltransferase